MPYADPSTVALPVGRSPDLASACRGMLDELQDWAGACIAELSEQPALDDQHDQGTFTTSWRALVSLRGYQPALAFMLRLRDKIRTKAVERDQWRHGYWRWQEAHHGTEHFELFLGDLWRLAPHERQTIADVEDMAEHLGNWSPEVPAWFDWDSGLFRSWHFGADGVGTEPGEDANVSDHLRCVNVALLAHAMTGRRRYLELAARHGELWARAIVQGPDLPVALAPGGPVYDLASVAHTPYQACVSEGGKLEATLGRAESFLASSAIGAFLALHQRTAEAGLGSGAVFQAAARRLLDVLTQDLGSPHAGAVADAAAAYRAATGEGRYDQAVLAAGAAMRAHADFSELAIVPRHRWPVAPRGVGQRSDMPLWLEDGQPRRVNPITLAHAAILARDAALATRAMDIAAACLRLARRVYPSGRDHGCSSRSVSAIARGHGRDNHAGVVTAALEPVCRAFGVA